MTLRLELGVAIPLIGCLLPCLLLSCVELKAWRVLLCRTPPIKLVEKLSFRLEKGSSILLTRHNGAGKSSIFRCMGGLWNIPHGTITKPGGASSSGLHQSIFYLVSAPIQPRLMSVCHSCLGAPVTSALVLVCLANFHTFCL